MVRLHANPAQFPQPTTERVLRRSRGSHRHDCSRSRADPGKYRPEGELEKWKQRDPIKIYRERLAQFGVGKATISGIEAEVNREVEAATEACKAAPIPTADILHADVYADGGWSWRN